MATKNKNIITYDINKLVEEYQSSLSLSDAEKREYESLPEVIKALKETISELTSKKSQAEIEVESLEDKRPLIEIKNELNEKTIVVNSIKQYARATRRISELTSKIVLTIDENREVSALKNLIADIKSKHFSRINEMITHFKSIENMEAYLTNLQNSISKHEQKAEIEKDLAEKETELAKLNERHEILAERAKFVTEDSLENFIKFLENNKLSTIHAEEIYSYIKNEKNADLHIDSIKIRKSHPKRDAFIKKVLVPTATTSVAIGGIMGAIAGSAITAGSTFAQIIPVMGSAASTAIATSLIGAGIGLIATPAIILTKNKLTKSYYNLRYKSAKYNLNSYVNGTEIEDLHISELIRKIENSKHSVLNLSKGNWFTKTLKFLPKHMINAVNRNRIHHLEKYTKDLVKMYANIHYSQLTDAEKAENLKYIYDLINQVDEFISNDTFESKLNAMLTCKESKKHTHKSTIENVDIFSNLITYVEALNSEPTAIKSNLKQAKLETKNLNRKTTVAREIINGERLITKMLNYNSTYAKFTSTSSEEAVVSTSYSADGKTVLINLENGNSVQFDASEIPNISEVQTVKFGRTKTTITHTDGTTTEIMKPKKVIPEIQTTRLVMLDKLKNDTSFVEELKAEGHNKRTVTSLIGKLTEWLENPTKNKFKVTASSNAGKLYTSALDKIDESMKENTPEVFEFDTDEDPAVLPEVVVELPID